LFTITTGRNGMTERKDVNKYACPSHPKLSATSKNASTAMCHRANVPAVFQSYVCAPT
jgi:hypothetical protein